MERPKTARIWHLPWRYGLFLLACASMAPLALAFGPAMGIMLGFDLAAALFIATLWRLFACNAASMREHARENEENRTITLVVTGVVMIVVLVVIASELRQKTAPSLPVLGLVMATIILAWLFSNLVYTMHYAYLYYLKSRAKGDARGLVFPDRDEPDYWDFAYFALTLGMTFQTSDIEITSPTMRKVALFHCLAAFVYNLGIIAFTINIVGGG